jgi:N-acetylglucosaminyl transferase component (Gpi1)
MLWCLAAASALFGACSALLLASDLLLLATAPLGAVYCLAAALYRTQLRYIDATWLLMRGRSQVGSWQQQAWCHSTPQGHIHLLVCSTLHHVLCNAAHLPCLTCLAVLNQVTVASKAA